jgi:hypothetical protein
VQSVLDTSKAVYKPVDDRLFVEPSHYKEVSDGDVLFEKGDADAVLDMMGK